MTTNDLDARLDRADAAIEKMLAAWAEQTQLLRTLVDQTRYQYVCQYTRRYRIDTRTGKWKEIDSDG